MSSATGVKTAASPESKSGLVWLASYPKSGNTWTRLFLSNLAAIMAGEAQGPGINAIGRFSTGADFVVDFQKVLGFLPTQQHCREIAATRHRVQQRLADRYEGMVFTKTHNALVIDRDHSVVNFAVTAGAVYVIRNPFDVAISLAHHMSKTIDEAIETMASFDIETPVNDRQVHEVWSSWSRHVESWTRKPHPAIHVMRYEDMLGDPQRTFGALTRHLRLDVTSAELAQAIEGASFERLRDQEEEAGFVERPPQNGQFFREGRA